MNHHRPDLPLRLLSFLLRAIIASPLGSAAVKISQRVLPRRDEGEDWVDLTEVCLTLPRLQPEFDGYKVAQISDFHIGTWITRKHLIEAVELVNGQNPDLVAITGDFVTYSPESHAGEMIDALSRLTPRDASVAVLGNHDHWTNPWAVRRILRASGIVDLSNTVYTLSRGVAKLHIAGIDDYMNGRDRLDLVLEQLGHTKEAAILLAHEPDFADLSARSRRFDLQISGHSHGGQVCLPYLGPPFLPRYARKYPSGFYQVDGMKLYTNRGLGTAEFNLRLNCRPEITIFTLCSPILIRASKLEIREWSMS